MKPEGWKGKEALNPDLEFWNIVAKPADRQAAKVGDAITIETRCGRIRFHRIVIVTKVWVDDDGNDKVQFRELEPGETHPEPTLTIIAMGGEPRRGPG